jgi:hypothetical protein
MITSSPFSSLTSSTRPVHVFLMEKSVYKTRPFIQQKAKCGSLCGHSKIRAAALPSVHWPIVFICYYTTSNKHYEVRRILTGNGGFIIKANKAYVSLHFTRTDPFKVPGKDPCNTFTLSYIWKYLHMYNILSSIW